MSDRIALLLLWSTWAFAWLTPWSLRSMMAPYSPGLVVLLAVAHLLWLMHNTVETIYRSGR